MQNDKRGRKSGKPQRGNRTEKPKTGKSAARPAAPRVHGGSIVAQVETIASKICDDEGLELVHVEFISESHHYYLRIYIDKDGGVTMGDCTRVSRQLADVLDVHQIIDVEYRLEVSSPGISRPLFKKSDFTKFIGHRVVIRTLAVIEGKKKFTGILNGISETDCVTLSVDDHTFEIDFSSIKKARLAENNGDDKC